MVMIGTNLTLPNDEMSKMSVENLIEAIRSPKPETEAQIRQLRGVYSLNPKQYNVLKRQLPYFVCGMFNPPYRRKENFAYTEYFVIDIDKLQAKEMDVDAVKLTVEKDSQVLACFKSPSEDGLKIMFRLDERCYDSGIYSVFYKQFLKDFSTRHSLNQVIDGVTSDVSRACFISVDKDAYFNPDAETVNLKAYVGDDDPLFFFETKRRQEAEIHEQQANTENKERDKEPTDDILKQIKARLNPKSVTKKAEPEVPEILNEIINEAKEHIESFGVTVTDIRNIQYGKKIACRLGNKLGEVNLFFGKRGFSVVKSPKAGTDKELNDILCQIMNEYINTYY